MFHVKHYSIIGDFYNRNDDHLTQIELESIIDLIYSNNKKKIIFYDDELYMQLVDAINLSWEIDKALIIGPRNSYANTAPPGFNQDNIHSIGYFTKIYSAFKSDIKTIICASSQKDIVINKDQYHIFSINSRSEYDNVIDFCKKNYENVELVDGPGEYAKRGGLIDIYPHGHESPKRISFLNETVEIKNFNIETQRTIQPLSEIKIATLQKQKILKEVLVSECLNWENYKLTKNNLVINNSTNNKNKKFPFKIVSYSLFKKINENYNVKYEKVNRLNGFLSEDGLIVPDWFQKPPQNILKNNILDVASINIGDFIVHRDHGIGQFVDFRVSQDTMQESMIIKYADNGSLTVDIAHLEKITFYASKNDNVQVDSLNKPGIWKRKKNNAKKNVQNIVNKLVNAYVNRENAYREIIAPVPEEKNFINEFKYVDTADQYKCWNDIKNDLKSNMPMDRLICGDVGFGKTELAIRTAYRYITNGKKVILLAPTTILTEQLYKSFYDRLNSCGILLEKISRLRAKKEIVIIQDHWINNQLDIIIGTHAILYNELYLNNCDLLIIDEEHRFGVKQKEKIKEMNPSIDILTMSATPIPRTLNLALSGLKQISTLSSPPKNRKPIITNINYFNDRLIVNTINNEILRKGQVYFVHNNVKTIASMVDFLEKEMPYLKINYIHGQMDPQTIEKRMNKFTNHDIDVLVCTSIIENGIDIPNVNTVIINNAHRFGLSQLYQIRGRVGRASQQAYALLIIPAKLRLNHAASLRLKAIEKYTSLGSGYKISNMDLTIRGGGSMFGYDQSGNIESIGYELVSKLINEYIHDSKPASQLNNLYGKINLLDKGIIPTSYIFSTKIRLLFYRKIKACNTISEINEVQSELQDRFGNIPKQLIHILSIQKLSIKAQKNHIISIEENKNHLTIHFERFYWEQNVSYLLNKINEFNSQQAINYEIKEFKESLVLKITNDYDNSIQFITDIIELISN